LKVVCVFAASSAAVASEYATAAAELGGLLARHGVALVYGAGRSA